MIIMETALAPCSVIDLAPQTDARGWFARAFCAETFAAHGLPGQFVQHNLSFNARRGTLRGLHFQADPAPEGKLVRCIAGAIFDVVVDIRPDSPDRGSWVGLEMSAADARAVYVPPGFAHGFQTLTDETTLFYQMTAAYSPALARGIRWNDPSLAIPWPIADPILSDRDAVLPLLGA